MSPHTRLMCTLRRPAGFSGERGLAGGSPPPTVGGGLRCVQRRPPRLRVEAGRDALTEVERLTARSGRMCNTRDRAAQVPPDGGCIYAGRESLGSTPLLNCASDRLGTDKMIIAAQPVSGATPPQPLPRVDPPPPTGPRPPYRRLTHRRRTLPRPARRPGRYGAQVDPAVRERRAYAPDHGPVAHRLGVGRARHRAARGGVGTVRAPGAPGCADGPGRPPRG